MRRKTGHRDLRQREMLLPIAGGAVDARYAAGSWQAEFLGVLASAADRYGKPQLAVWAGCDQRSVENWIAGRNLPTLEPALRLAQHIPEVADLILTVIGAPLHKREVA
ncbi:MAG: hypothetical protein J0H39_13860 [Alphaproteobacteria bacterium]|nr:hypothetical protein [Alphaproteobacteria bacterium]